MNKMHSISLFDTDKIANQPMFEGIGETVKESLSENRMTLAVCMIISPMNVCWIISFHKYTVLDVVVRKYIYQILKDGWVDWQRTNKINLVGAP